MLLTLTRTLCIVTIFWSALLLILVQPIVAKALLPWFGGAAGVWVTSMLFFQVLLLGGYLYAHLLNRLASAKLQVAIHAVLLVAALTCLPLGLNPALRPGPSSSPETAILLILASTVGLPYFVLSTSTPLVQAWYSSSSSRSLPWRLYAVSNLGSLLALIAYPPGFEKWLSVRDQMSWWTMGFWAFGILAAGAALATVRRTGQEAEPGTEWPGAKAVRMWLLLAAIPSVMWLSMAAQFSHDIGAIPFIWTIPLAVYLLSFVLTFESDRWYRPEIVRWVLPPLILLVFYSMFFVNSIHVLLLIPLFLATLLVASLMCHGELARRRPGPQFVTYFYLVVSAGGALGGLLVGVAAPRLFNDYFELPAALSLTLLLVAILLFRMPARTGIAVFAAVAAISTTVLLQRDQSRLKHRNFYGLLRTIDVETDGPSRLRELYNGSIRHGAQLLQPEMRRIATTYYGENTMMANVLRLKQNVGPVRVGVVGLGVGTMAAYARRGDTMRFYDINPDLPAIARREFTYLNDCLGTCEVLVGDARVVLEHEPPQGFDLLILDAFSGDSVPAHLITREAVGVYLKHLKPNGVLAFHISSIHLNLEPQIAAISASWGLSAYGLMSMAFRPMRLENALWVIVSRDRDVELIVEQMMRKLEPAPVTWTDDYSDLLSALK
ncbi:MAG: fused MFS/spermidine synthase [Bryobacteraceae bacterium]|nr:fused MFS/spermidine synthase [Bryobacteraceae bacterium]